MDLRYLVRCLGIYYKVMILNSIHRK